MTPLALDIAVCLVIFLSLLVGYLRGLIREVFTLVTIGVSVLAAYTGGHMLVPEFNRLLGVTPENMEEKRELVLGILSPPLAAQVFSYGGMFLFAFIAMSLLGHLIRRVVNEAGLALLDRILGGGFGFLRGFLLVFLLYVPFTYLITADKFPEWAKQSRTVPILKSTLNWANEHFELDKKIEDRGGGIAIKFNKLDIEKMGSSAKDSAEEELNRAIKEEEQDTQKGAPDQQPDRAIFEMTTPPSDPPPPPEPVPAPETPAAPIPAP